MTKALLTYLLFLPLLNLAQPAKTQSQQEIVKSDIAVKRTGHTAAVKFGSTQQALLAALGKPQKISPFYFEIDNKHGKVILYPGAKFYIIDDKLDSFEITSADFYLSISKSIPVVKVGTGSHLLPGGKQINKTAIAYETVTKDYTSTDEFLEFDLDKTGRKVTKIMYGDSD